MGFCLFLFFFFLNELSPSYHCNCIKPEIINPTTPLQQTAGQPAAIGDAGEGARGCLQFWVPSSPNSWQSFWGQTTPNCTMVRASFYTEAFEIVDLYILKKNPNIYFYYCFRTREPVKSSPSLKCREVSCLVSPAYPSLAGAGGVVWLGKGFPSPCNSSPVPQGTAQRQGMGSEFGRSPWE